MRRLTVLAALGAVGVGAVVGLRTRPSLDDDVSFEGPKGLSSILAELPDGRSPERWIELLDAPDAQDRYAAAFLVSELREGPAHVPALAGRLGDPVPRVRWAALESLGRLGPASASAVPAVLARLDDEDPYVRRAAARAAGRIGGDAVPALLARLLSGDDANRAAVRRALIALGPTGLAPIVPRLAETALSDDATLADEACAVLAAAGEPGRAALIVALGDPRSLTAVTAAVALGATRGGEAVVVPALEAALPRRPVRDAALDALASLGAWGRAALARAAASSDVEIAQAARERLAPR